MQRTEEVHNSSGVIVCGSGAAQPQSQVGQQHGGEVNAEELQEEGQESQTKDQETDVDQLQSNLPILTDGDQSQVDHNDDNTTCCSADCCSNYQVPYQPSSKQLLGSLSHSKRNFQYDWIKKFSWITLCLTIKKVFCLYCRYAYLHNLFTFSKSADKAFSTSGFNN